MTRNEYERIIQNQKQTIDQLETKLRELGEQFAEAAKAPPEFATRPWASCYPGPEYSPAYRPANTRRTRQGPAPGWANSPGARS